MKRRLIVISILILICALAAVVLRSSSDAHPTAIGKISSKPSSTATKSNNTAPSTDIFDSHKYSTSDPTSIWAIINKHHPLAPKTYDPNDLTATGGGQYMRQEAAHALAAMLAAAKQSGLTITSASAYRSYTTQVSVYNREVTTNGQATADSQSARPGYSEHQTGLAVDLAGGGCSIEDCFGTTAEGKWVAANAYKYGFIMRYTPEDVATTGYRAEPWHFRYVGVELATKMHEQSITTLEKFFNIDGGADYR